jgi:hypothetical protein
MDTTDPHAPEVPPRREQLKAQVDALTAKYEQTAADPLAAAHEHEEQMAKLDRIHASLKQTQAALDPARLTTTVALVLARY